MNRRSVNLRDATRQDIIDICSAMEQLFLAFNKDETPYIYIINLLELLLQSARTRVCILRIPKEKNTEKYTLEEVKNKYIIFANFRDRRLYEDFCKRLTNLLNSNLVHFFSYELEKIPTKQEDLYFCLPRITTKNQEVELNHTYNKEVYHRIRQLLQTMYAEKDYWGVDLLTELYSCLNNIKHVSNLHCPDNCSIYPIHFLEKQPPKPGFQDSDYPQNYQDEDNLLEPINEWVNYVYKHASESRLVKVPHHQSNRVLIDYKNIFFFIRVNKPNTDPDIKNCDSFDVKIICPDEQRKELSLYFHEYQTTDCQWYKDGKCKIHGMPKCEFDDHWKQLPAESGNWEENKIIDSYASFWSSLEQTEGATKETSESAFRSNSVVFERYGKLTPSDSKTGYVRIDPEVKRDRVMACIRYRLLPTPDDKKTEEDNIPQVMFVPIYTGGAPFVLAATVVNANRPQQLATNMSEWRISYRFAGMIMQQLSSRLKEASRKAYLNKVADILGQFDHTASGITAEWSKNSCRKLIEKANQELAEIAILYPFPQIQISTTDKELAIPSLMVNDNDRHTVTLNDFEYEISIQHNRFWCHYSHKAFFSLKEILAKLVSARARLSYYETTTMKADALKIAIQQHKPIFRLIRTDE